MQGWIKLHRQLAENPLWLIKPFSEGQAWVDLILITTYDEGFIKIKNGEIIKLKRGECGYSQLTLSERWGWSRGKIKRFLNLLESEKMIQQKIVGNFTVINILNYDKFQNDTTNSTTNDTTDGQQTIQQTDTIKNVNKENNEKNIVVEKLYGEYQNVFLSDINYNKLLGMCLSKDLLNQLINCLSEKIEEGSEQGYKEELPNAHFVRLKKYYDYRKKHPENFSNNVVNLNPYTRG